MNARKYAWRILHAEIRRRVAPDEGQDLHPQLEIQGLLMKQAREEGISELAIIFELARFGATYAVMHRTGDDPLAVAKRIEQQIMSEPDEDDDNDGDN
jgi:hypothetical protein